MSTPLWDPVAFAKRIRADFPIFQHHSELRYLDNAATTQKPAAVIDAISGCYQKAYAPVHRGLYPLAEQASEQYENARATVAKFVGAHSRNQLVFTRSATEAINLVAQGWALPRLSSGDQVWVTRLEHHANFLPWQRICQQTGAELNVINLTVDGQPDLNELEQLDQRCKFLAMTLQSNVLGLHLDLTPWIQRANELGIPVLLDVAQAVGHQSVDIQHLGCDFLAFSAHKMFGPSGIGALVAKPERLTEMDPLLLGGGMVDQVSEQQSSWADIPARFEAGSPNLADAVGFAAAVDYLTQVGMDQIQQQVLTLTNQAVSGLKSIPGIRLFPDQTQAVRSAIVSFEVNGVHPHDLAQIAGEHQVAIRAGHHCCQPLMEWLGVAATARAGFALYNQPADIDALLNAIEDARQLFS